MNKFKEIVLKIKSNTKIVCPFCLNQIAIVYDTFVKCNNHPFEIFISNWSIVGLYYKNLVFKEELEENSEINYSYITKNADTILNLSNNFISSLIGLSDQEIIDRLDLILTFK